ncbi:hypothetical protein M011DRAFT_381132, partial [Sporormia fimetaria CBS 119925]
SPSPRRRLPNGPCNYRDQHTGACGCAQFWDKHSAEVHEEHEEELVSKGRSTWCVCNHHACFHLPEPPSSERPTASTIPAHQENALQQAGEGHCHREELRLSYNATSHAVAGHLLAHQTPPSRPVLQAAPEEQASNLGAPGLPRLPSVCLLSDDPQAVAGAAPDPLQPTEEARAGQGLAGLSFTLVNPGNRQPSVSSTVPDELSPRGLLAQPGLSPLRAGSVRSSQIPSPIMRSSALEQLLAFNRGLQLNVPGDTLPDTLNPDDLIQSATEAATPSLADTPKLGHVEQNVLEAKTVLDRIARLAATGSQTRGSPRPTSGPLPAPPLHAPSTPSASHDELQRALQSASPVVLQRLVSFLGPLHNLLNSIPNVANAMREVTARLDHLENHSFNPVQPEEIQQQLELYDGRLLDLEHRLEEHESLHQALDADNSSISVARRPLNNVTESFGSNHSVQSAASAIVHVPVVTQELQSDVADIKDRLEVLEAAAMPSSVNPWDVEVVLLPWGPELRGIWHRADQPMHDSIRTVTQDSEDWTQGRRLTPHGRSSQASGTVAKSVASSNGAPSLASSFAFSDAESGWSSEAISNWVDSDVDDWLSPKACGEKTVVYRRLLSRGFVRKVTFKSASSRDIQKALSDTFADLMPHLRFDDGNEESTYEVFPGLRAPFIPLRKMYKQAKLQFLTRPEMASSALWSAQFLAAGVMMRVSGGQKRLYVTQRESYLQQSPTEPTSDAFTQKSWTWQGIRELPRYQPDTDSPMHNNDPHCQPHIPEADAKEPCWAFFEKLDLPPPSATSSFNSANSAPVELSMRPADRHWRRSITPGSSILKNRHPKPMSPLSEQPLTRSRRARTFSTSIVEQSVPITTSKRRLNSSPVKQSSMPQAHSHSRNNSTAFSKPKRRKVRNSSSTSRSHDPDGQQIIIYNGNAHNDNRRANDLPSPFYSSHPDHHARSTSDPARSERSVGLAAGKTTPFAYATPYSGPIAGGFDFGGGDTEPDDDASYQDRGDDEASWRGVDDDEAMQEGFSENESGFSDSGDEREGVQEGDMGMEGQEGSSDDSDVREDEAFFERRGSDASEEEEEEEEDEDEDEIFDTL